MVKLWELLYYLSVVINYRQLYYFTLSTWNIRRTIFIDSIFNIDLDWFRGQDNNYFLCLLFYLQFVAVSVRYSFRSNIFWDVLKKVLFTRSKKFIHCFIVFPTLLLYLFYENIPWIWCVLHRIIISLVIFIIFSSILINWLS